MRKKQLTIRYIIFYMLFLPDAWQVLAGLFGAYAIAPIVRLPEPGNGARAMLYLMIAVIGYAVSVVPARWVTRFLIKRILGDKHP